MRKKIFTFSLIFLLFGMQVNAQWKINEGFENNGLPSTWTVYDEDGDGMEWWDDEDNPRTGLKAVGVYTANPSDDWLITPQINIAEGDVFSFWLSSYYNADYEDLNILISTTTNDISSFGDFTPPIHITQETDDYINYSYDLSDYAGQDVYIAIQCVSDNHGGSSYGYVTIDDVKLGQEPVIQIGNGDIDNVYLPMATWWRYSYSQVIYTAAEIGLNEPKQLNKIAYHYNGHTAFSDHAKILIAHTNIDNFNDTSWLSHDNFTEVYDGEFSVSQEDAWIEFELNTPFFYNGTDNIVVAFWDDKDQTGSHNQTSQFFCTATSSKKGLFFRNDNYSFDPSNPTTAVEVNHIANIQLSFTDEQQAATIKTNLDSINFGNTFLSQTLTNELIISNLGVENLEISAINCTGSNSAFFSFTPSFTDTITLAQGETHAINITYTPNAEGTHIASLNIESNSTSKQIPLSGNAVNATVTTYPYIESFKECDTEFPIGWLNSNNLWLIGSEAQDDNKCAAIRYKHQSNDEALLTSPPFVLPEDAKMSFWWKDDDISIAKVAEHDTTFFEISDDNGQTWTTLDTLSAEIHQDEYENVLLELNEYANASVLFRWRNVTDNTYSAYGTGVDNIMIFTDNILYPPFTEPFTLSTEFPEGWGSYSGLLTDSSTLVNDWTKWILQNYANDGTNNIGVETTFFSAGGAWLISPTIHLESDKDYNLEFDLALTEFQTNTNGTMADNDIFKVIISTDNGQTWTNAPENMLIEFNNQSNITNHQHESISLEGFSGNIKIGFYMESPGLSNDSELFVDNISVSEDETLLPPTNLQASVNEYDATMSWSNPNTDLSGYKVFRENTQIAEIQDTANTTYTDENLAPGTYSYFVKAIYSTDDSEPSNIVDVIVEAANISFSVNSISQDIFIDSIAQQAFNIENTGDNALTFDIEIVEADKSDTKQAGDLIHSFSAPDDMLVYGAGFDNGNLWLSDVFYNNHGKIYNVNQSGELQNTLIVDWAGSWIADIEATDEFIYTVIVNPSGDNGIKKINKTSGELIESITGEFSTDGSNVSQALAYNRSADEFWVGGWYHDAIYHTDNQGNTISTINTNGEDFHDVTGLAWHPNGNGGTGSLFVLARNPYMVYELNPETGDVLQSFGTYNNTNMNGLSIGNDGSLWMAAMGETMVYNIESGVAGGNSSVDWLSADILSGNIIANANTDIELTFDATNLTVGTYEANLVISHNVPNQNSITIPVTMEVSEYVNIAEPENSTIEVYPNPCGNIINIATNNENIRIIKLSDISGKIIKTLTFSDSNLHTIDVSSLPQGVYFIQFYLNDKVITKKIIIE